MRMLRDRWPALLFLFLAGFPCGCAATALFGPEADTGGVAVRVRQFARDNQGSTYGQTLHFAKLSEEDSPTRGREFALSTVSRGSVIYALELTPGRYAPVACEEKRDGRVYTVYFPPELIEATAFRVTAGSVVNLGRIDVHLAPLGQSRDETTAYYARKLGPNWNKATIAQNLFHRNRFSDGVRPHHDPDDRSVAARIAKDLDGTGWTIAPGPAQK